MIRYIILRTELTNNCIFWLYKAYLNALYFLLSIYFIIMIMIFCCLVNTLLSREVTIVIIGLDKRIKSLREANKWTQTQLAKKLNITRASVNAWEMGISNPSTEYIVKLAKIFDVSTDYLLGLNNYATINITGLSISDVSIIYNLANRLKR